jgi:hypothetical protein
MLITTFYHIMQYVSDITAEQIGRCHKIIDFQQPGSIFYKVETQSGSLDADGHIKEYSVRYTLELGFTCDCPSGNAGFENVRRHPSGVCWHVRAVVACMLEEKAYCAELAAAEAAREEERRMLESTDPEPHNGSKARPAYLRVVRNDEQQDRPRNEEQARAERSKRTAPPKQPSKAAIRKEQKRQEARQQKNVEAWAFLRENGSSPVPPVIK